MKRGTPRHPKVAHLAELLKMKLPTAVGYLELLWHFTAEFAPQGDVGRFADARIEAGLYWAGSAGKLVSALLAAGFLERRQDVRLVVHDWHEHADASVIKRLQRSNLPFLSLAEKVTEQWQPTADNGVLPEPEPTPEPMPEPEPCQSQATSEPETGRRPARAALEVIDGTHPTVILTELKEIYHRAGLPIAPRHEQLAAQYLLDIPPEKRHRVADYVKHCLLNGKWRGTTTTKSLLNLLRDGDWDVPIVERELPPAPGRAREPSRREANTVRALEIFKRERGEA